MADDRLITLAIHTYDRAVELRRVLEGEGIEVTLQNVNLQQPKVSSGVRVRIHEADLAKALRIVENADIFTSADTAQQPGTLILVPVDFSPHSLNATAAAFALASTLKADVSLLHSYIDPYVSGDMQLTTSLTFDGKDKDGPRVASRETIRQNALWDMSSFATHLRSMMRLGTLVPAKFTTQVVEGVPEDSITEQAKALHPALVVMGTRGAGRKKAELIGSVTAEVLDQCRATVLAIPETVHDDARQLFSHILLFASLDQGDILAIDTLYRMSPIPEATVTLVNVASKRKTRPTDKDSTNGETLLKYCRENFPRFTFELQSTTAEALAREVAGIEDAANTTLIVVTNRRRSLWSRLFSGSLARKIIFRADIPVMSIPV